MQLRGAVIEYIGQQSRAFHGEIPDILKRKKSLYGIAVYTPEVPRKEPLCEPLFIMGEFFPHQLKELFILLYLRQADKGLCPVFYECFLYRMKQYPGYFSAVAKINIFCIRSIVLANLTSSAASVDFPPIPSSYPLLFDHNIISHAV